MAGARRWVWNWALARRIQHYTAHHTSLAARALCKELTVLKQHPETEWLREIDSQLLQEAVRDLDRAFRNFFEKRAHFPKFKTKKRNRATFRIPQRVKVHDVAVYVPKIGCVRMRQSRPIEGRITSATFTRNPVGRWDVSFVTQCEVPDAPLPTIKPDKICGIDDGLTDFVVLSDGTRVPAPRFFRKTERRLRRVQQHLSRCQRGSRRRERARQKIARVHHKVANQRYDFVHKTTTRLVNSYEGLCTQDLNVKGLAKTKLARSVHDAALGELHRQLQYKTAWNHKHLAVVDRWFPSSKLCGRCGVLNDSLTLADREWRCQCGTVHDRDLNAACNIRAEGLRLLRVAAGQAETENARVRSDKTVHERHAPMIRESLALATGNVKEGSSFCHSPSSIRRS